MSPKKQALPSLDTSSCRQRASNDAPSTSPIKPTQGKPLEHAKIHVWIYNSKMKWYARRAIGLQVLLDISSHRQQQQIGPLDITAKDLMRLVLDLQPPFQSVNRRILATPLKRMEMREQNTEMVQPSPLESWKVDNEIRWDLLTCLLMDDRVGLEVDGKTEYRLRPIRSDDCVLKLWALEDELDDETISVQGGGVRRKHSIFKHQPGLMPTPPRRRSSLTNFVNDAKQAVPLANWIRRRMRAGMDKEVIRQREERVVQACLEGRVNIGIAIDDGSHPNRKNLLPSRTSALPFWPSIVLDWITSMSLVLVLLFFINPVTLSNTLGLLQGWTRWDVIKVAAWVHIFRLLLLPRFHFHFQTQGQLRPRHDGKRTQFGSLDDKRLSPQLISLHVQVPDDPVPQWQGWQAWAMDQVDTVMSTWENGVVADANDAEEMELWKSLPKWWSGSQMPLWEPPGKKPKEVAN